MGAIGGRRGRIWALTGMVGAGYDAGMRPSNCLSLTCTVATEVADCNNLIICGAETDTDGDGHTDPGPNVCEGGGTKDGYSCNSDSDCQVMRCIQVSTHTVGSAGSAGEIGWTSSDYLCAYP